MCNHHLLIDDVTQGQKTEKLREEVISLVIILGSNLSFEAIHFIELLGLMVTSAHKEVLWVAHFPCKQSQDDFD